MERWMGARKTIRTPNDITEDILSLANSYQAPKANNAKQAEGESVNSADLRQDVEAAIDAKDQKFQRVLIAARRGNGKLNSAAQKLWDLYIEEHQASEQGRKVGHTYVREFFEYLEAEGIDEPTPQDVLGFLRYKLLLQQEKRGYFIGSDVIISTLNAVRNFLNLLLTMKYIRILLKVLMQIQHVEFTKM